MLMLFEDVHWIDPSSRELLDLVVERVPLLPVLLLLTFRPEFQPPWTGQAHVTVLVLNRLDRREGAALVQRVVGTGEMPSDLAECIRLRGQIAAGRDDLMGAAHLFETAIATARRQQARLFELRAATQLAPVLARQGRVHEAATRLQAVVHTFNTRYPIVDLIAAQRALDTLSR
ncbi:hypothetical protein ACN2CC_18295 [Mesorhizobium muleiense]|uniref:hypothetical protein n=1 Tax=Mesorhizobium muleiense TaxID=1004279 RepID=UPI003AFAE743